MWPPPFHGFFEWVSMLPGSQSLREDNPNFFGTFLTLHVLSMCLFLGLVLMMDLRLVGVAHRDTPVSEIQKRLFPWQLVGAIGQSKSAPGWRQTGARTTGWSNGVTSWPSPAGACRIGRHAGMAATFLSAWYR